MMLNFEGRFYFLKSAGVGGRVESGGPKSPTIKRLSEDDGGNSETWVKPLKNSRTLGVGLLDQENAVFRGPSDGPGGHRLADDPPD